MIIVKLMGGIGNQMSQYAAGRRLAIKRKAKLMLDLTFLLDRTPYKDLTFRDYALDVFDIQENFVGSNNFIYKIKRELKLINIIKEPTHDFYEKLLSAPDNSCLEGYWQSEKYFKDVADVIRNELTVKLKPDDANKRVAEEISSCEAVSLHVRRGDYVSNPETNKYHGTCSLDYYEKAVERIALCVKNPYFFVFSDDPKWAQENLRFRYPCKFIAHNSAKKSYEDLRLMSLCRHNIIANSSFSWWGAWLNRNLKKIVIAPWQWFNDPSIRTDDLIPEGWIRI